MESVAKKQKETSLASAKTDEKKREGKVRRLLMQVMKEDDGLLRAMAKR